MTVTVRSPRFLDDPFVHLPCSRTPAGSISVAVIWNWSHYCHDESSRCILTFEALSHGFCTCCLRFTLWLPRARARLASGWLPAFTRQDFHLLGYLKKFPLLFHKSPPSRLILAPSNQIINAAFSNPKTQTK